MPLRRTLALLLVAFTIPIHAQVPSLSETLEVSIVNVDVFVTDKDGRRVHGLTKDDFDVFENGKQQEISNFAEYVSEPVEPTDAAAAPEDIAPPTVRRTIAIFIERIRLSESRAKEFIDGLRSLVVNTIRPGDAVAIMTWERYLKMRTGYTADVATLEKALAQIEAEITGAEADYYTQFRRDVVEMSQFADDVARQHLEGTGLKLLDPQVAGVAAAELHANLAFIDMKRKVGAIKAVINSMAAAQGKKVLLLAAHRFPQYAGAEFYYAAGENNPKPGVIGRLDTTPMVKTLVDDANAAGVTIYPLLPRGDDNTAGLLDPGTQIRPNNALGHQILLNDLVMTRQIAEKTGGLTAWSTTGIAEVLPRIEDDVTNYYSLAYRARFRNQDRTREVMVKTRNPEYVVRARRQFVEKSDTSRMRERVLATLFGITEAPTFTIAAQARRKSSARGRTMVPVKVRIPIDKLTLLPQAGTHVGRFSVFVATGAPLGDVSEITHRTQPVEIAARDLERARTSYFSYSIDVTVDDRADRVAIGILDEVSKDFALIRVPIRPPQQTAER